MPDVDIANLTPRELEIAQLAAQGLTNEAISTMAFCSLNTVKFHFMQIYTKLNLRHDDYMARVLLANVMNKEGRNAES